MRIIGITGGVGSGKSRVLTYIEETYSARICQADQVAWELQKPGAKCYQEIVEQFGAQILQEDGTIDRKTLGQIVFADAQALAQLNGIMHPAVKQAIRMQIKEASDRGEHLFVIEAALLLEENYDAICDEVWYIYSDEEHRRMRLKESRGYTDEKIDAMMASQLSEEVFRQRCGRVIENSGSFDRTCEQITKAMETIGEV